MGKKIFTSYVDATGIRLLITDGKRIKRWADLPLEPGLIESADITKEAEVAAKLKQLLKERKILSKNVIVGLSGHLCLTRPITLPQLPRVMLDEAVMREAKRVLPVPLEQLYVSWQTIPSTEGKIQVFLVAVPRKTADAVLRILRQAGLKPYLMDLKPLALARMIKEPTAIMVDVQPAEFDIVIMADGVPQPIRTVPFPNETLSWQEKLPLITDDLDRTIKFYNSANPEKPLDSSVPIYVSGEPAREPELHQSLSDGLENPVLLLSWPVKYRGQFDSSCYMVNIGLALKELPKQRQAGTLLVNLNALPAAYQPKPISWGKVVALPSVLVVIGLLFPLVMLIQSGSDNITSLHNQLDMTNQLISQRQLQKQELQNNIAELDKELAGAEASQYIFTTALDSLDMQGAKVNGDLKVAINALPSSVSLTSIGHMRDTLTLSGRSPTEVEILSYARSLDNSHRFSDIIIASIKTTEDVEMNFILVLKMRG